MAETEVKEKHCPKCDMWKPVEGGFYTHQGSADGYRDTCIECCKADGRERYRRKAQAQSADEIINQIEDGKFEVDQKWLLKELITQYKNPKCRDPLKCLQMIKEVSGYNSNSSDDKAVMDSLIESMKNGDS